MTLDKSYYSSIRYPSKMRVRLVNHTVPTKTPYVQDGFVTAQFTGFESYNYHNNTVDTINETVERPIGSFGYFAQTPKADEYGGFDPTNQPKIVLDFGYNQTIENVVVFLQGYATIIATDGAGSYSGGTSVDGVVEIPTSKFLNNVTLYLNRTTPNSSVKISAIVYGDVVTVDPKDLIDASENGNGDVTGAKLISKELLFSAYDREKVYNGEFNTVVINHAYNEYLTPYKAYIVTSNIRDTSGETPVTTIKAVDVLSALTDLYTNQRVQKDVNDISAIESIIESAHEKTGFKTALSHQKAEDVQSNTVNVTPIFEIPYNSVIHALSFVGAHLFDTNNDVIEIFNFNKFLKAPTNNIKLKEYFNKPTKKEYPLIKNGSFSFTNSIIEGAEKKTKILEKVSVDFDFESGVSNAFVAKIKLPSNYFIPEYFTDSGYIESNKGYVWLNVDGTYRDVTDFDIGWLYGVENGYLYIYDTNSTEPHSSVFEIYALPITNTTITKSEQIGTNGEDLELKSDVLSLPMGVITNQTNEWKTIYKRITLPYNYINEYTFSLRGRFDIDLYDVIFAEIEKHTFAKCVVTSHKLSYNGAHKSDIKAVVVGDTIRTGELTPQNWLYPSENLTPKGAY